MWCCWMRLGRIVERLRRDSHDNRLEIIADRRLKAKAERSDELAAVDRYDRIIRCMGTVCGAAAGYCGLAQRDGVSGCGMLEELANDRAGAVSGGCHHGA